MNIGYNTKGIRHTQQELQNLAKLFKGRKLTIRLQGGTISQKAPLSQYTLELLQWWRNFQIDLGCELIYVVNLNHTPAEDNELWQRCKSVGLTFIAREYGNEQYLNKFRLSDLSKPEVTLRTSSMTPLRYLQLCNEYNHQGMPVWLQLAPIKGRKNVDARHNDWNNQVLSIEGIAGYALHIYAQGGLDLTQITDIQSRIGDKQLHITEWGLQDEESGGNPVDDNVAAVAQLGQDISSLLRPQDGMYEQVMHNPWQSFASATTKNGNQYTFKGLAVFNTLVGIADPTEPICTRISPLEMPWTWVRQTAYFDDKTKITRWMFSANVWTSNDIGKPKSFFV